MSSINSKYRILVYILNYFKVKDTKTPFFHMETAIIFQMPNFTISVFSINCKDYTCMYVWFIPVDRSNRPLCFVHYVLLYNHLKKNKLQFL